VRAIAQSGAGCAVREGVPALRARQGGASCGLQGFNSFPALAPRKSWRNRCARWSQ